MKELREPISRTSIVERRIRRYLESKYGSILDEATRKSVILQETKRMKKRQLHLDKARLKLLKTKDVARLRLKIRKTIDIKDCPQPNSASSQPTKGQETDHDFIEVEY
jgi:hypothetical protein